MLTRTLSLTSPPMTGDDVREYQLALRTRKYLTGEADGVYGPVTAQATFRAKYWIGYAKPDQRAGRPLEMFLTGEATPSKEMNARRAKRLKAAQPPRSERIVALAVAQVGITEQPAGSNKVKFSDWYGLRGPWCAMFVTWVYVTSGFAGRTFVKGRRYAFVPFLVADARAGQAGLVVASAPADGVLACYDWQHDGQSDHIGICANEATLRKLAPEKFAEARKREGALGSGDFWAIEGNTAVGNDSNGGEVMIRRRNRRQVQVFARVT